MEIEEKKISTMMIKETIEDTVRKMIEKVLRMLEVETREITEKKMTDTIADIQLIDEQIQKLVIVDTRKMLETMSDETIYGMMLDEMTRD